MGRPQQCNPCCGPCFPPGEFLDDFSGSLDASNVNDVVGGQPQEHPDTTWAWPHPGCVSWGNAPRHEIASGRLNILATGPIFMCMRAPAAGATLVEVSAKIYPSAVVGAVGVFFECFPSGPGTIFHARVVVGNLMNYLAFPSSWNAMCGTGGAGTAVPGSWASGDEFKIRAEAPDPEVNNVTFKFYKNGSLLLTDPVVGSGSPMGEQTIIRAGMRATTFGEYDDFRLYVE